MGSITQEGFLSLQGWMEGKHVFSWTLEEAEMFVTCW